MRRLVLAFAVGCSHPSSHGQPTPDAAPVPGDVASRICSAPAGTASVLAVDATSVTFGRLDAGGVWNVGPVNGAVSAPVTLALLVTNGDPLTDQEAACCAGHATDCCTVDGLVITTGALPSGGELGAHPAQIERFLDRAFALTGTLDVTTFDNPFEHAPGRIAGSITAVDGSRSVSGSLDNTFCAALLTATI